MDNNQISQTFKNIFDGVNTMFDTKKVVGEPMQVGDATIIPFIETSIGMGTGSFSDEKSAGGMGCKITPVACLVVQNGMTKLVNIKNQDLIGKALDMIPDLVSKMTGKPVVSKEVDDGIDEIVEEYDDNEK